MKLAIPISFIVIAGILFFFIIDPVYGDIKQLKTEVATYSLALDNSTELQKTRDSLVEIYKNIKKEDKDRLDHFLPRTISNIELILEIEKIASLYGMPIRNINFESNNVVNKDNTTGKGNDTIVVAESDPNSYLPYGVFPMEFAIEGSYDNFQLFLNDLEHNLRLVDIKSISFSVPEKTNDINNKTDINIYSYKLKIETYWLK